MDHCTQYFGPSRRPASSTRISKRDSSKRRWSPTGICWRSDLFRLQKAKGVLRLEGKEYRVQEGDVILFRFNL